MTTSGAPPRPLARLAAALAVAALAFAGCGSDDSSDAESAAEAQTTTTTAAPTTTTTTTTTTTAPPTTTTTAASAPAEDASAAAPAEDASATATASAPADDASATASAPADEASATAPADDTGADDAAPAPTEAEQAVMDAWAVVFDSEADYGDKVPHLENAAQLESTVVAYADTGKSFGGVSLEPTAVAIDGDVANVTYNVLFGGSAAYSDLSGEMQLVEGIWVVSRDTFCGFMSSARTPCQD